MLIDKFIFHIRNIDPNFEPNIILDIGSRDLEQSIEFNSVYKNSIIYAFEPNPEQFSICLEKSKNYKNIKVEQLAISEENGKLNFFITHGNVGASSLLEPINVPFASTQDFTKITVDSVRLDKWLENNQINNVDIMWLDTQGVELSALKSMGNKIKNVKFIHCEASELPYYKGHLLKKELSNFLLDLDFDLKFINDNYHPFKEGDIIATNKKYVK
jgi:FkbM family methyltransferase